MHYIKGMKQGWLKRQAKRAGYVLSAAVVAGFGYVGWQGLSDYKNQPAPESELSVNSSGTEIKNTNETPSPIVTAEDTFRLTIEHAGEKYTKGAKNALYAYEVTGIDPFVMMGVEALENNFSSCHSDHDAKGCHQIQSGTLVTWLHRYGEDMHYFKKMDDSDPRKVALQTLLKDRSSITDEQRGHLIDTPANDNPEIVKTKANRLSSQQYQILSDLRLDDQFSAEISALNILRIAPEAKASNFTDTFENDQEKRSFASAKAYLTHNQGSNILDELMTALENTKDRTITIAESPYLKGLNENNVTQNQRIFPNGMDSFVSCTSYRINSEIKASMKSFTATYKVAEMVLLAGGTQNLIQQTWPAPNEITSSKRPVTRPNNLPPQQSTTKTTVAFNWESSACEKHNPSHVFKSPRPRPNPRKTTPQTLGSG